MGKLKIAATEELNLLAKPENANRSKSHFAFLVHEFP